MTRQISFSRCRIDMCQIVIMHHHCTGSGTIRSRRRSKSNSRASGWSGVGSGRRGGCSGRGGGSFLVVLWNIDVWLVVVVAVVSSIRGNDVALGFLTQDE